MDALTHSQKRRFEEKKLAEQQLSDEEALRALKNLMTASESKDLIRRITIGEKYGDSWDFLYLTNEGLYETISGKGHYIMLPSTELVRKYNLTKEPLVDLLARLKA